jgi:hypothetical protein
MLSPPHTNFLHPRIKSRYGKKHLSSGGIEMFLLVLQIQDQPDCNEANSLIISHLESPTYSLNQNLPSLSSEMYEWV